MKKKVSYSHTGRLIPADFLILPGPKFLIIKYELKHQLS